MIDINKKYRYAGDGYGTPRILCIDRQSEDGNFPVVSMDIYGGFYCHQENGVCIYDRKFDLIEVKDKKVLWLNVYNSPFEGFIYREKERADDESYDEERIARIKVEYEKGQFDE